MQLIASERPSRVDLDRWERTVRFAEAHAKTKRYRGRVRKAVDALASFSGAGPCYAGVSWGKDSVALAHMVSVVCPRVPLIWVRVEPIANPDCVAVRDAFLASHPRSAYDEIEVRCVWHDGEWHARGTLETGFSRAGLKHGGRHISGIRGDESGGRKRRMMAFGHSTKNTCAPIGFWSDHDLWAYTFANGLPVHPAYACTMDGLLDPSKIRVASLTGKRGEGMGRAEWEERYYGEELARLRRGP